MAEARRNWKTWLVVVALAAGAAASARAQKPSASTPSGINADGYRAVEVRSPATGSLAGRLTDLRSTPLAGVAIVLRNEKTGFEQRTVTAKNGSFRFTHLEAGAYTLTAGDPRLGRGQLEGIEVTGGAEARLQAAMHFEPVAPEEPPAEQLAAASPPEAHPSPPPSPLPPSAATPLATAAQLEANPQPVALKRAPAPRSQAAPIAPLTALPLQALASPSNSPAVQTAAVPAAALSAGQRIGAVAAAPVATSIRVIPAAAAEAAAAAVKPAAAPPAPQPTVSAAKAATIPRAGPADVTRATAPAKQAVPSHLPASQQMQPSAPPVTAAAQETDPAAAATTATLTAAQIAALPASGRHWQQFLLNTPSSGASQSGAQESYRGSQESADVTVDGADRALKFGVTAGAENDSTSQGRVSQSADQQEAMSQSRNLSWNGQRGFGLSEAAIHKVTATAGNVEAAGVRTAGGRTGIETERGGSALHGTGFYFDRQNNWGARNPFTQRLENTGSTASPPFTPIATEPVFASVPFTPPDHESVWGLGVGGPIAHSRFDWFAAVENNHRNDPGLPMARIPIANFVQSDGASLCVGLFCPPSYLQAQLLSAQLGESVAQAYDDYFGLPGTASTHAGLLQLAALLAPAPRTESQWTGFARIDWQASDRNHLLLEATGALRNAPGGGLHRVSGPYGAHSFGSERASQQWTLAQWETFFTPNLQAVTQASAGRTILSARAETPSAFEQAFLAGNIYGQLPQIVVDSRYGFTIGNPARFGQGSYPDEKLFAAQERLTWAHNRLIVKAGFEVDHDADALSMLRNQTGTYHYPTVARFLSDALAFLRFGYADALDPRNPHNCDATGKPWTTSDGGVSELMGLGALPCYSSYSQMMGPTHWHLSTNDWAGYATAQWRPNKFAVVTGGLRWEREQLPPPLAALDNPQLPFTEKLPDLGNNWGPRVGIALGNERKNWPVLRLGYGLYYGRVPNATVEAAMTQTGSLNGDLYFFMRAQDDCQFCMGGAPPFPYVFAGEPSLVVMPGALGFAPHFHNPEVHEAVASVQQRLPAHMVLSASAMASLGRRLPIAIDTNLAIPSSTQTITYQVCDEVAYTQPGANPNGQSSNTNGRCGNIGRGPIKAAQITLPFYAYWPGSTAPCPYPQDTAQANFLFPSRPCPNYQQITQIEDRANSTYEAATLRLARYGRTLSFHAHYTYAHAMDWNPDGVALSPGDDVVDPNPALWKQQYGTSNLDVRHSAALMAILTAPWKLRGLTGRFVNGWMLSGIGSYQSGLPYSLRVGGSVPTLFGTSSEVITGLGPSPNGSGGDNLLYGAGSNGVAYAIGRNTYRYPAVWKADLRLGKTFNFGSSRQLEVMAETFNLFNHQNVTEIETTGYEIENGTPAANQYTSATLPTLNFLTGLYTSPKTGIPSPAFGEPLTINTTNFYRERQIQFGLQMHF